MPEWVLNASVTGNLESLCYRVALSLIVDRVIHNARSVSEAVRDTARYKRVITVEVVPIVAAECRHAVTQAALMKALSGRRSVVSRLRVKCGVLNDKEPIEGLLHVISHTVPLGAA